MKKISILVLHLGYGGIERAITTLANMLCNDFKVEIISIYKLYNKPAFELDKKVEVKYLLKSGPNRSELKNAIKKKNIFKIMKEGFKSIKILSDKRLKMIKAIKECDADIIISSRLYISNLLVKYGKKGVITIAQEHRHHNNDKKYINGVVKMSKKIDYLMPVSQELTDYLKKFVGDKCIYIPHCLEDIPDTNSSLTEKRIISIGRLAPEKGFLDLIDVFKIVNKKYPDWKLDIIGDGDQKQYLINKIKDLNLEENVTLHGYCDKEYINNMLAISSIYTMTSLHESFGLVLLEAGSLGLPVVVFDSARGALEIIKDGYNGFIIENRNKDDMANKIIELINDKDLRIKMGKNAKKNVLNYSFDIVKEKWLELLKK